MTTAAQRLLLVGTPSPDRDSLQQLLSANGYEVSVSDSNGDALQVLQSVSPDLLLITAASSCNETIAVAKSKSGNTRIVVLSQGTAEERAEGPRRQARGEKRRRRPADGERRLSTKRAA